MHPKELGKTEKTLLGNEGHAVRSKAGSDGITSEIDSFDSTFRNVFLCLQEPRAEALRCNLAMIFGMPEIFTNLLKVSLQLCCRVS